MKSWSTPPLHLLSIRPASRCVDAWRGGTRAAVQALCFASCSVFRNRGVCFSLDGGSMLILKARQLLLLPPPFPFFPSLPLFLDVSSFSPSPRPWPPPWELRMASLLFFLLLI